MNSNTKAMALSGLLAALAVVIMSLGGMIPFATYVCPVLCCILCCVVLSTCGKKFAWVWYAAVSLLSLLLGPDKEAAGIFLVLGYYPIIKPIFDRSRLAWLWKGLFFQIVIFAFYLGLIYLLGLSELAGEFGEFGAIGLIVMLIMGNLVFFLLDRVLNTVQKKFRIKG